MEKAWSDLAWEQYTNFLNERKIIKKINELIKDIDRNGAETGIGRPEKLKGDLSGFFSREIDEKNRLVYKIIDGRIFIYQCGTHYGDK